MNSKLKIKKSKMAGRRLPIVSILFLLFTIHCSLFAVQAQTTAFSHQGQLNDNGAPANGNYDLEFRLFSAASGGAQQGSTLQRLNVAVANGIFAVSLDFGTGPLSGDDRYLDIAVRLAGGGAFTPLAPRQQITSTPYAVRSLTAATADTVVAAGVPPGSGNYIQNTTAQQAESNFRISGTGRANIFSASTQYDLGGVAVLRRAGSTSVFIAGGGNSNTSTDGNIFVGSGSGGNNTNGFSNTFVGGSTGVFNTTGDLNAFFGILAGTENRTGNRNTMLGADSNVATGDLSYATAIGSDALASLSNSVYLGRPGGEDTVRIPGGVIVNGSLVVDTLGGTTGNEHLCRNTANRISLCTSNFAAPGETEDLRAQVSNQQKQIDDQRKQVTDQKTVISTLQAQVEMLKAHICSQTPSAAFCKPRN